MYDTSFLHTRNTKNPVNIFVLSKDEAKADGGEAADTGEDRADVSSCQ